MFCFYLDNAAAEKVLENVGVNEAPQPIYLPKVAYFQDSSIFPISEGSLSNITLSKPTSDNENTNKCDQKEKIWCKKKNPRMKIWKPQLN